MRKEYLTEPLKIGTPVKILNSRYGETPIQVGEFRGTLGPNGARVYGVFIGKKRPRYVEVLEEQLEVVPPPESVPQAD